MIGTYSREVPLLPRHLATLRAPGDDPEAALIAAEDELFACEHAEQGPELSVPGFSGRVLRSLRLFVPPEEAYLLEAHFMLGQEQTQIAHRLGRAKQSVQYRIHRALERLRWVDGLQTWDRRPHEIRRDLACLRSENTHFAVTLWAHRWNQSATAHWFAAKQSMARTATIRLLSDMAAHVGASSVRPYREDLIKIFEHRAWNMGRAQQQGERRIRFPALSGGR